MDRSLRHLGWLVLDRVVPMLLLLFRMTHARMFGRLTRPGQGVWCRLKCFSVHPSTKEAKMRKRTAAAAFLALGLVGGVGVRAQRSEPPPIAPGGDNPPPPAYPS